MAEQINPAIIPEHILNSGQCINYYLRLDCSCIRKDINHDYPIPNPVPKYFIERNSAIKICKNGTTCRFFKQGKCGFGHKICIQWCKYMRCKCSVIDKANTIHPSAMQINNYMRLEKAQQEAAEKSLLEYKAMQERQALELKIRQEKAIEAEKQRKILEIKKRLEKFISKGIMPNTDNYEFSDHIECQECNNLNHKHFWQGGTAYRDFEDKYPYIKAAIIQNNKLHIIEPNDDFKYENKAVMTGLYYCRNCYYKENYGSNPCQCPDIKETLEREKRIKIYNLLSKSKFSEELLGDYCSGYSYDDPLTSDSTFSKSTAYLKGEIKSYESKDECNHIAFCNPNRQYDCNNKTEKMEERGVSYTGKYFCEDCLVNNVCYDLASCIHCELKL
jgi:hypothetical protein